MVAITYAANLSKNRRISQKASVTDTVRTDTANALPIKSDSVKAYVPTKKDSVGTLPELLKDTAATDTAIADSTKKKSGIEAPVQYTAKDSMTYYADDGCSHLYGDSKVDYQNMTITAEELTMNMDSSLVHAVGRRDSAGSWIGKPVYKQGTDSYESEKMSFNFKTKKGFINNVNTTQGEGFLQSQSSKRSGDGTLYLEHAKYTTCDDEHPHFYIALSRAKMHPGKEVIFGPAYLVVADVPLPLAIPYGFFPFKKKYSSGILMPTYGDETNRGFYLRDGGYYFAISDKMDLKLLGEVYTKGSWGLSGEMNYIKRYRYSGNFYASYLNTIDGEKNMPDYAKTTSFKVQWSHRQDAKASPNSSFSASVNFATTNYERSNLTSLYDPLAYTQSTRTSSVSYSRTFEDIGLTLSSTFNLNQNMQDSSIAVTMPDLNISLTRLYPFKRKKLKGKENWYEKISLQYSGQLSNSINTKENKLMHSDLIKDWRNGMNHNIPISASFNLFKYINISPSFTFVDRMYTNKTMRSWDETNQTELRDTTYGFYNVYNWYLSLSANTTLYGFYKPYRKIFGDGIIAIRHVMKPSISYSYAPNFGSEKYGYYDSYVRTDASGNVSTVTYSPYSNGLFGVPSQGKTGNISMSISNNLEMKVKSSRDSTGEKKISLIDEFYASMSYNMAAESRPWSNLSTRLRLKLSKSYTFSMAAVFATYAYKFDQNGKVVPSDRTEWSYGRFGRFQGMSQNLSYTFSNNTLKKLFGRKEDKAEQQKENNNGENENDETEDTGSSNLDPELEKSRNSASRKKSKAKVDEDGYLAFSMPWSLSVSYGISMRENTSAQINSKTMRYPYSFTQTMNFSGNMRLSEGWNINFSSGYDFDYHQLSMTTASLSRDLHCFTMSCSVVLRPYTSYNFTFKAKASALADALKWDKRSSYSTNIDWY